MVTTMCGNDEPEEENEKVMANSLLNNNYNNFYRDYDVSEY